MLLQYISLSNYLHKALDILMQSDYRTSCYDTEIEQKKLLKLNYQHVYSIRNMQFYQSVMKHLRI